MSRHEWMIPIRLGEPVCVKRWLDMRPGEPFYESFGRAADGVINALSHADCEQTAREIYADRFGDAPLHLDDHAWGALHRSFANGDYVLVPARRAPAPPTDWANVPLDDRLAYVMRLLVDTHRYSVAGAAGIVGNVYAESGVLPNRLEGSSPQSPMRALDFARHRTTFSATDVMNRSGARRTGPLLPGVGLAQWTSGARRSGLFHRVEGGRNLGVSILDNMDAQVAYLVGELRGYAALNATLTSAAVTVDAACDDFLYVFEVPASIVRDSTHKWPRSDPRVQSEFARRRPKAHAALRAYQAAPSAR